MKKFVLAFMLLLLLAGCDAAKLTGAKQEESSLPDISSVPASISQAGAGASSNLPAESSVPASSGSSVSSSSETVEAPDGGEEGYDASEAVTVESVDGGIKVTFEQMPQTARDLQALLEVYPQTDARNAGAFFIASLVRYVDSADDGLAMIDLLRGPRPMNDMDKMCIRDRLGYFHEGDLGIPQREAFAYQDKPDLMAHHLYVCPPDSLELRRHLTFRDYLRTHPAEARKYSEVKRQAAALFPLDIDGYMAQKDACVKELYQKCGLL